MKILLTISFLILAYSFSYSQEEYMTQHAEVLAKNRVIKVYKFSAKNEVLSYVVELDTLGRPKTAIRPKFITKAQLKHQQMRINEIIHYSYDHNGNLNNVVDTVFFNSRHQKKITITFLDSAAKQSFQERPDFAAKKVELQHYTDGRLKEKRQYDDQGNLHYIKNYSYQPKTIKTQFQRDGLITEEFTMEYEKGLYDKRFYGYELNPLVTDTINNIQYQDYKQAKKQEHDYEYQNNFDELGRLVISNIKMSDIRGERTAIHKYEYNKKDLLIKITETIYSGDEVDFSTIEKFEYDFRK